MSVVGHGGLFAGDLSPIARFFSITQPKQNRNAGLRFSRPTTPAKAGAHVRNAFRPLPDGLCCIAREIRHPAAWVPAFAGMDLVDQVSILSR
jgi:hypothetical protein